MTRYPPRRCDVCGKTICYSSFAKHQRDQHGIPSARAIDAACREEDLTMLADTGETLDAACARLGINRDALWKWCWRNGQLDMYERLARRQRKTVNQYTAGRRAA